MTAPLRMRTVPAPRGSQTRSMSSVLSESGVWAKLSIACMDTGWWPIGNFDPCIPAGAWCDGAGSGCPLGSSQSVTGCLRYPIPVVVWAAGSPRGSLSSGSPSGVFSASPGGWGDRPSGQTFVTGLRGPLRNRVLTDARCDCRWRSGPREPPCLLLPASLLQRERIELPQPSDTG